MLSPLNGDSLVRPRCAFRTHFNVARNRPVTRNIETRPRTIADLKQRIQDEVAAIPVQLLREVMNSCRSRLQECERRNGSHLEGVTFKT